MTGRYPMPDIFVEHLIQPKLQRRTAFALKGQQLHGNSDNIKALFKMAVVTDESTPPLIPTTRFLFIELLLVFFEVEHWAREIARITVQQWIIVSNA